MKGGGKMLVHRYVWRVGVSICSDFYTVHIYLRVCISANKKLRVLTTKTPVKK